MSYASYARQLRHARRQLQHQQHQLAALELEGIVTLSFQTLTRTLTLPVPLEVAAQASLLCHEALADRRKQLRKDAQKLTEADQDAEQIAQTERAYLKAAKKAQLDGHPPLPYPLP